MSYHEKLGFLLDVAEMGTTWLALSLCYISLSNEQEKKKEERGFQKKWEKQNRISLLTFTWSIMSLSSSSFCEITSESSESSFFSVSISLTGALDSSDWTRFTIISCLSSSFQGSDSHQFLVRLPCVLQMSRRCAKISLEGGFQVKGCLFHLSKLEAELSSQPLLNFLCLPNVFRKLGALLINLSNLLGHKFLWQAASGKQQQEEVRKKEKQRRKNNNRGLTWLSASKCSGVERIFWNFSDKMTCLMACTSSASSEPLAPESCPAILLF